jgi:2-polyprenyl-3-methyl-5-hydroxy-6-metoxy-1,4-benzoquinol methylase
VLLKETFARSEVHDKWESVYRNNPRLDRFNEALLDRLVRELPPPSAARLLDAGCGVGYHTLAFARRGYACVGIDVSPGVVAQAEHNRAAAGLDGRASFACEAIEELAFADGSFDVVHCRGVLMHVPEWRRALRQLCRVVKPGGRLVVIEGCSTSLESWLVRLLRTVRRGRSVVHDVPGGLEFWAEQDGLPIVTRVARVSALVREMADCGLTLRKRFATEFWDVNRFPAGLARRLAIDFNRLSFARVPASLSMGNALIASKA